jgi:hypothetical protein
MMANQILISVSTVDENLEIISDSTLHRATVPIEGDLSLADLIQFLSEAVISSRIEAIKHGD